jgi:putative endonuclease
MSYFVYILLCNGGSFYTGSTNDVEKRLKAHFAGMGAKYTKSHKPIKIIYQEEFDTKSEALKREAEIKKLTKRKKEDLVKNWNKSPS